MGVSAKGAVALLAMATLWIGCGADEAPVGTVTVEPHRLVLGYPGAASIDLGWTPDGALGEVGGQLKVMIHLQSAAGDLVRTFDHPFPESWQPGTPVSYSVPVYQSLLGPALQPGVYRLTVGLYDLDGKRWPLTVLGGEDLGRREYAAVEVEVPERWEGVPELTFGDSWGGVEGGADLQILGRRSMHRTAELEVGSISEPGSVWLRLRIPEFRPGVESLQLDAGETEPRLTVGGSCGDFGAVSCGFGAHRVELPIDALDDGSLPESCDFEFSANFTIVEEASGRRTSAHLEGLSWAPRAE
jgi:hypothetical protein